MSIALQEILTLVGRLDDTPGFDTPRERFRRFLAERVTDVAGIRALVAQCQEALGDQHARARQDLLVMLGRYLGFEVTFGGYEPRHGSVRVEGHWRSRRQARIVLEVRSEQTQDSDVEELSRTVAALSAAAPPDLEERWVGLCVTTPFYAARRRLEALLAQRDRSDIRCVTVESLLWLAEMASTSRLEHADVIRLLTSGPDSDLMIDLMRRLSEGSRVQTERAAAATVATLSASPTTPTPAGGTTPHLTIVEKPDRERETLFWLASLTSDENATPELVFDSVIRRRHLLGIAETGPFPPAAQAGDWVCFFIRGTGVVGHARLDSVISDASAVIRGARRFTAVFRLRDLAIYEVPNAVAAEPVAERIAGHMPFDVGGAFLASISRADYQQLTIDTVADRPRTNAL